MSLVKAEAREGFYNMIKEDNVDKRESITSSTLSKEGRTAMSELVKLLREIKTR